MRWFISLGHVQRCLMSRLYGRIFAKSPFMCNSQGKVVVSPVDGSGPCSEKSTCQHWSRAHATDRKNLISFFPCLNNVQIGSTLQNPFKIKIKSKNHDSNLFMFLLIRLYSRSDKTYVTPWILVIYLFCATFSIFL
jgi:hypothetical protein